MFFYGYWNPKYIFLILASILFNFTIGIYLSKIIFTFNKKYLLIFGIFSNLLLLGYFKYTDFLLDNLNKLTENNIPLPHIVLPLGISFFTFTQIAFLVDCYRGYVREHSFFTYSLFVTYFPHLLAGPILHHSEMIPQFSNKYRKSINSKNIISGLFLFSIGLFKKVVIADTFAIWATAGFDRTSSLSFFEAWSTSLSYTFQLYFDFSGYTDMAVGISLLFNIKLPINFNSPYKACNIQDFWRRWHMTLSRFLRDYIYIPLGGNRYGSLRTYVNLFITFFLGGLWHGAGWTFIFWGILHGLALIINRFWQSLGFRINKCIAWLITFNFINITWIFFRAKNWQDATKVIEGMFNFQKIQIMDTTILSLLYIIVALFIVLVLKNSNQIKLKNKNLAFFIITFLLVFSFLQIFYFILETNKVSEFLYFNF